MKVDLAGRVRNLDLPKSRPLLPLLEAVSNSIHSIEDSGRENGRIVIRVIRDNNWILGGDAESRLLAPITGFEVEDNGVGFTPENFESFETCDSLHKQSRGAKGIGRLLWLKAFTSVRISSSFRNGSAFQLRQFQFGLPNGVHGETLSALNGNTADTSTKIVLDGFQHVLSGNCPKKTGTIADRLLTHLATNFLNPKLPAIELRDDASEQPVILNDRFKEFFSEYGSTEKFELLGYKFEIHHLRLTTADQPQNSLQLAASFREVEEFPLKNKVANLGAKLTGSDGHPFSYLGIVTGSLLDERANSSRTGFSLPRSGDLLENDIPTLDQIISAAAEKAVESLAPFLQSVRANTRNEIEKLVQGEHPEYRPLMRVIDEKLDSFPAGASPNQLLRRINEIQLEEELATKEAGKAILYDPQVTESEDYAKKLQSYLQRVTEESETRLAQYVSHRKVILDLLAERLKTKDAGKFELEEAIHELIFPMKVTSDDPGVWGHQNLWLVDERLAYHRYLASDKQLKTQEPMDSDSRNRPDLLIFNRPGAFSTSEEATCHNAVTIIELKRPGRTGKGSDKKTPIEQICGYIDEIKKNTSKDRDGRLIRVTDSTAFYAYVVCDFEPGSDFDNAARMANLIKSPDGRGYFGFISGYNAYMEMVSFDKLVDDARQRNRVFFQRLGIDRKPAEGATVLTFRAIASVLKTKLAGS